MACSMCILLTYRYAAGRMGSARPACLSAATERANELFRREQLSFLGIPRVVAVRNAEVRPLAKSP
jgi:1-deoxy-D-xylulose 5-phosphate reductoisomerase